ncbi:uncharacterized protein LOC144144660 [Haemaphysalis longicornis]
MEAADAPLEDPGLEEIAQTIQAFAEFLFDEEPDVFDNVFRTKRFLELADRRFRGSTGIPASFFDPCSQDGDDACWAVGLQQRWNAFLNLRGIEMIALHERTFSLQTFQDAPNVLLGADDVTSLCACLWILRNHRCISKVALDMSVVARYHPAVFWRLLRFQAEFLEDVELKGFCNVDNVFYIAHLLNGTTNLFRLALTNLTLSGAAAMQLGDVLGSNRNLETLILKEIHLTATDIKHLALTISVNENPWMLELRGWIAPGDGQGDAVASLLATTLGQLYLEVSCDWAPFFRRLAVNHELTELEIVDCSPFLFLSLNDLANALLFNYTLKRLKLQMCMSSTEQNVDIDWQYVSKAIRQNLGLQQLSFAFSSFGTEADGAVAALGDALAENQILRELSVEGCELSSSNLMLLLNGLSRNVTLQKLHIGALEGDDLCQQLLKHITKLNLSERVDWVCKLNSDLLQWAAIEEGINVTPNGLQRLRKLKLLLERVEDSDNPFPGLYLMSCALTSLSIGGDVQMNDAGAETFALFFIRSAVLDSVSLLFPASERQVVLMLNGLSLSKTVSCVVVGGDWRLIGAASVAFEQTLHTNTSITELTIAQRTRVGFEELKCHLQRGLQNNYSVSKLRLLYGADQVESRDSRIVRLLQCNRMLARWATSAISESYVTRNAAYAVHCIMACDSGRLILRQGTGYSDEELDEKLAEIFDDVEKELEHVLQRKLKNDYKDREQLRDAFEVEHSPLSRKHPFTLQIGV